MTRLNDKIITILNYEFDKYTYAHTAAMKYFIYSEYVATLFSPIKIIDLFTLEPITILTNYYYEWNRNLEIC